MHYPVPKVLLVSVILTGCVSMVRAQEVPPIDWEVELGSLGRELSVRHPDLYSKTDSISFFTGLRQLAARSGADPVFPVSVRLQQYLAATVDASTRVNYHFQVDHEQILPLECFWFREGIVVLECRAEYRELLGRRIIGMNGFPLEQVIDSFRTVIGNPTPSRLKEAVPRMLTWNQLLVYFGFSAPESVVVETLGSKGDTAHCRISLPARDSEMIRLRPDSLPLGWQNQNKYFWHNYLEQERTCYIQYNKCWSRESEVEYGTGASALFMPLFGEFEKEVLKTLKRKEVQNIVIDLRFNDGGHPKQGREFMEKLSRKKPSSKTRFFLLVGRKTDAEALENAVDAIRFLDPVIVGEPTPSPPNHFGEIRRFVMTTSRIVVNYPSRYIRLVEDDPPALTPDLQVAWSFSDFLTGRDPALEKISRNQEAASAFTLPYDPE